MHFYGFWFLCLFIEKTIGGSLKRYLIVKWPFLEKRFRHAPIWGFLIFPVCYVEQGTPGWIIWLSMVGFARWGRFVETGCRHGQVWLGSHHRDFAFFCQQTNVGWCVVNCMVGWTRCALIVVAFFSSCFCLVKRDDQLCFRWTRFGSQQNHGSKIGNHRVTYCTLTCSDPVSYTHLTLPTICSV